MATGKRIAWIDWAKFILIWLMVWGHCFLTGEPRQFIYAFHMPAFFIISGYLYKQHDWRQTTKAFGIPVLFFLLLNLAYYVARQYFVLGKDVDWSALIVNILPPLVMRNRGNYLSLFTGLWFIVVLYLIRLFMGDIKCFSFVRKKYKYILPLLIVYSSLEPLFLPYLHQIEDFYAYKILSCMPFVMTGIAIKEYKDRLLNLRPSVLVLLVLVYVTMTIFNTDVDISVEHFGRNYSYTYVNAVLTSLLFFNILKRLPRLKFTEVYSQGTFLILGLHIIIRNICHTVFRTYNIPSYGFVYSLIIMLVCYFPIVLCMRYAPILLGKVRKK